MARRNDHTRDEIKTIAIEAGHNLIKKNGFTDTSARKIAGEIGYTVGTLYNVFQNYNELMLYINAKTLDTLLAYVNERRQQQDSNANPILQAQDLAHAYIDFATENYLNWRALYEFTIGANEILPNWYAHRIEAIFESVSHALDGIFKDDAVKLTHAKIIWASVHGICQLALTDKLSIIETQSAKSLTSTLVENYLCGAAQPK